MLLVKKQPLYSQVAEGIKQFIIEGDLSLLPSEEQLAKLFDVSKNTAREALAELKTQGIIEKIHGTGNVVMKSALFLKFRIDASIDFLDMLEKGGYEARIVHLPSVVISEEGRENRPSDEYFSYKEYILADNQAACETTLYLPVEKMLKVPEADLLKPNMFSFIKDHTGERIVQSAVHFIPEKGSEEIASLFHIPQSSSLISWEEIHYTGKDNPLCYTRVLFNPKIFRPTMIRKGYGISERRTLERCQLIKNVKEL